MPNVYSLRDAALILGSSASLLKYHIYVSKFFSGFGRVIGHSMVFTQDEIDAMVAKKLTMPRPGKPEKIVGGVRVSELAYNMRQTGMTFADIAQRVGFSTGGGAFRAAKRFEAQTKKRKPRRKT